MIVRWQRLQAYTLNLEQVFFLKSRANNALVKPKWAVYEVAQNAGRCNKLGMSYKTPLNNKSRKQSKRATSHEESFCKVQFIRGFTEIQSVTCFRYNGISCFRSPSFRPI